MENLYLYVLKIDSSIVCISHSLDDTNLYISQFQNYFSNHNSYEISIIRNRNQENKIYQNYSKMYLYPLNSKVVLTDLEISYYSPILREMYLNEKSMISQIFMNNSLIDFSMEERVLNTKTFDMLYEKMKNYESFLETLDTENLFKKYIIDPWIACGSLEDMRLGKLRWNLEDM